MEHSSKVFTRIPLLCAAAACAVLAIALPQSEIVEWQLANSRRTTDPGWFHATVIGLRLLLGLDALLLIRVARGRRLTSGDPAGLRRPLARSEWRVLIAVLVLAAGLRLWNLDCDLWLDEIATVINFAHGDLAASLATYPSANHHPLNSLLVRLSVAAFGESNWSVRLPAAIFGIAAVGAMYFLARTITTRREALPAAVLLACSYHHVYFSQSARGYSGYLLGAILATAFYVRLLQSHRVSDRIAYVAAMLLAYACHPNTIFIGAAHVTVLALVWLFPARSRRCGMSAGRDVLAAHAMIVLGTSQIYMLMLPDMFHYFRNVDTAGVGYAPLSSLFWTAFARGMQLGPAGLAAVSMLLAVVAAGFVSYFRQNRWTALLCILPINLGLVVALAIRAPIYPRYFLFGLPIGLLLLVRGIHAASELLAASVGGKKNFHRRARSAEFAITTTVLLAITLPLVDFYRVPRQPYTQALQFVSRSRSADAHTVALDLAAHGCCYYASDIARAGSLPELAALEAGGGEVWLLCTFRSSLRARKPELAEHVDLRYREVRTFRAMVGEGEISVCRTRWPAAPQSLVDTDVPEPDEVLVH